MQTEKKLASALSALPLTSPLPVPPTAQVDVLSAALRASSLDAREEASDAEKRSDGQDALGANELPNCKTTHDASVPLISDAVEVTHSVERLSSENSSGPKSLLLGNSCSRSLSRQYVPFVADCLSSPSGIK